MRSAARLIVDGSSLVVAGRTSDGTARLSFLDAATGKAVATVTLPGLPGDLVVQP